MNQSYLTLALAVIGLVAFLVVMMVTTKHMTLTATAWTRGGAVALAVAGLFALLLALGRTP